MTEIPPETLNMTKIPSKPKNDRNTPKLKNDQNTSETQKFNEIAHKFKNDQNTLTILKMTKITPKHKITKIPSKPIK